MADNVLSLTKVTKSFGSRTLFSDVTLGLDAGQKLGLIGDNGTGKSTLLRIIDNRDTSDTGHVARRQNLRVGFLEQVPTLADTTVHEALAEPLAALRAAIQAYETAVASGEDAHGLLEDIEHLGGWDWQHRVERVASELNLTDLNAMTPTLSGGQQKRVALARLKLSDPDLILLDEPTNHLDADTVTWLENWLAQSNAAAIVVTHDRYFLDRVVERMAEVREGQLRTYVGNYTDYLICRAEEEALRERTEHRRLQVLKTEVEWARRGPKARTTKQKARLERLEHASAELDKLATRSRLADLALSPSPRLGKTILELDKVTVSFDGKPPLFAPLSLIVRPGERLGLVGPNGAGKTTLLRLITGDLPPTSGTVTRGINSQIAYFDQHRTALDPKASVREILLPEGGDTVFPDGKPTHIASWLARFAFPQEAHVMRVGQLSGGEKNRLAIARFLLTPANMLLLDEPTNDLDLMTLQLLEAALIEFAGCVFVVSHDRYFLDKVSTGVLGFAQSGALDLVQGGYTDWSDAQEATAAAALATKVAEKAIAKVQGAAQAKQRSKGLNYSEKKELAGLEARVAAADAEVGRLEAAVIDPQAWRSGNARALQTELDAARAAAATLYARWEALMTRDADA